MERGGMIRNSGGVGIGGSPSEGRNRVRIRKWIKSSIGTVGIAWYYFLSTTMVTTPFSTYLISAMFQLYRWLFYLFYSLVLLISMDWFQWDLFKNIEKNKINYMYKNLKIR